jgi:hypothetical protein
VLNPDRNDAPEWCEKEKMNMGKNFEDALDERFAPSWKPEIGEKIQGIVTTVGKRTNNWGEYPILTIRVVDTSAGPGNEVLTDEEMAIHCSIRVLNEWVTDNEVSEGDRVAIRYDGQKKSAKGQTYYDYARTVQKANLVPLNLHVTGPTAAQAAAKAEAAAFDVDSTGASKSEEAPW